MLLPLAVGVVDAEIVLRVLVIILGGNSIVAPLCLTCQGRIAFEYLRGRSANSNVGAVAVEYLIALRVPRPLGWTVSVETAARPLIWS